MYKYACCEQINIHLCCILRTTLTINKITQTDPGMSLGRWHPLYGSAMQDTQTHYISGEISVRCGFMTNCQVVKDDEVPLFHCNTFLYSNNADSAAACICTNVFPVI
jgi:hypothetical protein